MSIDEYRKAVATGDLDDDELRGDSRRFDEAHPNHALAARNSKVRLTAADFFHCVAAADPTFIDEEALSLLHDSAFDCDAAVRLTVVQTLGLLGREESLPALDELIKQKLAGVQGSPNVQEAATEARCIILKQTEARETKWIYPPGAPNWPR
jgi:HEAT repeat protein